MHYSTGTV